MSLFNYIVIFGIFFASLFSLVAGIGAVLSKPLRSPFLISYLFLVSFWLFLGGISALGLKDSLPFNVFNAGLFVYSLALPLFYFDYRKTIDPSFRLTWIHFLHSLCFLVVLCFSLYFQRNYGSVYSELSYEELYYNTPGNFLFSRIVFVPSLFFLFEMILLLSHVLVGWKKRKSIPDEPFFIISIAAVFNIGQSLLWIIDRIFHFGWLWVLYFISGFFIIGAFFVVVSKMDLLMRFNSFFSNKDTDQTTLKNVDKESVLNRLSILFEEEKIYKEDVRLESVASRLSITSHQLSELINSRFKLNFSALINSYRVKEAKEILVKDSETLIVDIGFSVGFSSPSSFYRAFGKEVGISPAVFRRNHLQKAKNI